MKLAPAILLVVAVAGARPTRIDAQAVTSGPAASYVYSVPEATGDGWDVANVDEVGVDATVLAQLVTEIREQRLSNLHSVLVIKNGKLVFEEYFEGPDEQRGRSLGSVRFDRTTLHDLRSVTKSITSALVGLAVGRGLVGPSDLLTSHLPDLRELATGAKAGLSVKHLLTMTSGLEWDERTYPYTDPRNSETAMDLAGSSVRYVLTQDLVAEPGTRFQYCGGCTMLLAAVVREATGKDLDAFADEMLFRPLGITEFEWLHHTDGLPIAASGLRLRPRDVAKIGYLYVNDGRWKGEQILPSPWVEESTRKHIHLDSIAGYGYQWWVDAEPIHGVSVDIPIARGNGGQRIYVVRELDLVVVITAGNYNSAATRFSEQAFWRFVLPASSQPALER